MATHAANAAPDNSTDANFRAWINVIHNVMTVTGGWVQTADTGQINFATVTRPLAANTKQGYAIYGMNDALQATKPIYIKFGFGSGSNLNYPGIWFAIGTATDGAGTFIDTADSSRAAILVDQYSQAAPAMATINNKLGTTPCFGSAATARAVFFLFEAAPDLNDNPPGSQSNWSVNVADATGAEASYPLLFSIERAKDSSGTDVGTHIIVTWTNTVSRHNKHIYVETDHQWVPLTPMTGMTYALGSTTYTIAQGDSTKARDVLLPGFERNCMPRPGGISLVISRVSLFQFDISGTPGFTGNYQTGATTSDTVYGTARTYRVCAGIRIAGLDGNADTSGYIRILYQ